MPNGDTIRRRPQYGLPFQQLPQADVTPESALQQEIQTGRQAIQDKYALQWKEVNRSRRFIGRVKASQMLQQIDTKAKQEMLQFNQQAQQQLAQLQNIDRLAQQGAITNPEQIKARMTFGTDVARAMYPEPERERTVALQFGELDRYSIRIEGALSQFRRKKERIPSILLGKKREAIRPGKVQIWDPTIPGKWNKETEEMEYWRDASPEEIQTRNMYLEVQSGIERDKARLLKQPDISRRRARPGVVRSGFDAGVTESIKPQRAPAVTKPKVIRQRNTRTGQERISYDGGKTWQIVSG